MRKRGRNETRTPKFRKRSNKIDSVDPRDMDDEIDAFLKMRDKVPLVGICESTDSAEDLEQPVLGNEDIDGEFSDEKDDENEDRGLAAKIVKQQRYLRSKFGGVDEEMAEDDVEEEEKQHGWGGKKSRYHGGDNHDFELKSSDDEALKEEEEEILRLQREKAKLLSSEDFGISEFDDDGVSKDPTLELSVKETVHGNELLELSAVDDTSAYIKIPKDKKSFTREEQMDVVKSSAPELVGLLSELKDSVDELDNNLNPFFSKLKKKGAKIEGMLHYIEIKQILLLMYSQSIVFYLLLKSEGQSIRDHPIVSRIVEIKELLNKIKNIEGDQPIILEDLLKVYLDELITNSSANNGTASTAAFHESVNEMKTVDPEKSKMLATNNAPKMNREKHVGLESREMLNIRAAFEAKLKSKGGLSVPVKGENKTNKSKKTLDRRLETFDDYDDAATSEKEKTETNYKHSVSRENTKPKFISGDEDIPKRDDIGERRKRHELKVLAYAGVKSEEDAYEEGSPPPSSNEEHDNSEGGEDPDDDLYIQVKQKREQRLAAKSAMYKRNPTFSSASEEVDGKRLISQQIQKNRGLTRSRNKLMKNPRKKYRTKHDKAQKRRKGQVRDIKKPSGSYGGETTGINPRISRSVRF